MPTKRELAPINLRAYLDVRHYAAIWRSHSTSGLTTSLKVSLEHSEW